MTGRRRILALALCAIAGCGQPSPATPSGVLPSDGDPALVDLLRPLHQRFDLPAVAVAVVTPAGLERAAVVGWRRRGQLVPATVGDRWHLGSNGKAMSAMLAAVLVADGAISWDSTVDTVFPEHRGAMDPAVREVDLRRLLDHRSGLERDPDLVRFGGADGPAQRLRLVAARSREGPAAPPGTYSNLGYVIAGAMLERAAGTDWQSLMRARVFDPLAMEAVGFGPVEGGRALHQPWGHLADGSPVPSGGHPLDNPPVMDPAGRIHASLAAWARFVGDQLRGARGEPGVLPGEVYRILQTPAEGGEAAMGWMVVEREWAGGRALHHAGSNTMHYASVWMAPERGFAVLVCINQGGETAAAASDAVATAVIRQRLSP